MKGSLLFFYIIHSDQTGYKFTGLVYLMPGLVYKLSTQIGKTLLLSHSNPKTDKRICFVGGIRGLEELERRVRTDCNVAFSMYPTTIQELFEVADAGRLMPPKSTWFEPKLRSGLFLHLIGEEKSR